MFVNWINDWYGAVKASKVDRTCIKFLKKLGQLFMKVKIVFKNNAKKNKSV